MIDIGAPGKYSNVLIADEAFPLISNIIRPNPK